MSATPNTFDDPDRKSEHLRASPPLLPWPALDRLTRVHPAVPVLLYGPVIAVLGGFALSRMGVLSVLAWAAVGYALWTLTEYWLHRVVFVTPTWLAVSAGFLVGYVVYDTMHWYLHHRIPHSRLGKRLRELHLRHHFQDDTRGFGISAPYWDRIFRTAPVSRREAARRRRAESG